MESRKTQVMAIQQNQFFDNLPQLKKQLRLIEEDHLTYIPFEEYGRYRFPRKEIKKYSLVYSIGVSRDCDMEIAMATDNPNLKFHCFDGSPESKQWWDTETWSFKPQMQFHNVSYAKDNGTMPFYFNPVPEIENRIGYGNRPYGREYSLEPHFISSLNPLYEDDKQQYVNVETQNLRTMIRHYGLPDLVKADTWGVWYDTCREILDHNIPIRCFHIRAHLLSPNPEEKMFDIIEVIDDFKSKGYEAYLSRQRENFGCDMFFLK